MESSKEQIGDQQGKMHFHVLAVDDSIIERKMLEKLLTISSYHVTCVESGDKALEYLGLVDHSADIIDDDQDHHDHDDSTIVHSLQPVDHQEGQETRVNLIMTDYSMPGITGYDLLKRVKGSSWKDVPVVVMSSENVPSRIDMCLEGGAEEFLLKPVRLSDLKKLQPHILKSKTTRHCNSSEELLAGSSYNLIETNDSDNFDYKDDIMVEVDYTSDFDKGKAEVDDENFERRLKPDGLTAV